MAKVKQICVMGLGYIGLPTASFLATKGYKVYGTDVQQQVVDTINAGEIHISEPDLDILVRSAVQSGNLIANASPREADVFILAVPTPFKDQHVPDLKYVEEATRAIAPYIKAGDLVILESTSPVGTTEKIAKWIAEEVPGLDQETIYIAHCPERVLPGKIIKEFVENDRIVGGINKSSTKKAAEFYQSFVSGKVLMTDSRTAEMSKLTENTFRDVNIALANELSLICHQLEIDVWELIRLANHHPRVNILQPGPGVGGHCIAVDPWFIVDSAPQQAKLIRAAREVNDMKPCSVIDKVCASIEHIKRPKVACLGLTYKADVDDIRESPALEIARKVAELDISQLLIVEPNLNKLPEVLEGNNTELVDLYSALEDADLFVILVSHKSFQSLTVGELSGRLFIDEVGILGG